MRGEQATQLILGLNPFISLSSHTLAAGYLTCDLIVLLLCSWNNRAQSGFG